MAPQPPAHLAEQAREILAGSEFRPGVGEALIARWVRAIAEWLAGIGWFPVAGAPSGAGGALELVAKGIAALLVGVALALVLWLVWRLLPASRAPPPRGAASEDERRAPVALLLQWADEAESAGDWARAFRLLFWAGLKRCDEARWLEYSDDRTNWEVYRTRRGGPASFWEAVRALGLKFDAVHYGGDAADRSDTAAARDMLGQIPREEAA